jgi:hypothetical protein
VFGLFLVRKLRFVALAGLSEFVVRAVHIQEEILNVFFILMCGRLSTRRRPGNTVCIPFRLGFHGSTYL